MSDEGIEPHDPNAPPPPPGKPRRRRRDDDDDDRPRKSGMSTGAVVAIVLGVVCLIGFCVVGILVALLVPAVQKVRESAARLQTNNNLKQCALAVHTYHDVYNKLPDAFGPVPANAPRFGGGDKAVSMWAQMLPFLEQQPAYAAGRTDAVVAPFMVPLETQQGPPAGTISFAANLRIFGNKTLPNANSTTMPMPVQGGNVACDLTLGRIADGTTNTIMLTTKASVCGGNKTYYAGDVMGNVNGAPPPSPGFGGFMGAGFPSTPAVRVNPPDTAMYQLNPSDRECVAKAGLFGQGLTPGGMSVALCDSAVRNVGPTMSPRTFLLALCPADGQAMPPDWSDGF